MYKLKTQDSRREGELCFCYSGFIYLLAWKTEKLILAGALLDPQVDLFKSMFRL